MEEQNSVRRATVIDSGTGKPWIPPDAGWLSVKFRVSRELPNIQASAECLCYCLRSVYLHLTQVKGQIVFYTLVVPPESKPRRPKAISTTEYSVFRTDVTFTRIRLQGFPRLASAGRPQNTVVAYIPRLLWKDTRNDSPLKLVVFKFDRCKQDPTAKMER